MKIQLPEKVNRIITTLQKHGFEAYAVGGCVRDSFLGRVPGDWDFMRHGKKVYDRSRYQLLTPESSMERLRCF